MGGLPLSQGPEIFTGQYSVNYDFYQYITVKISINSKANPIVKVQIMSGFKVIIKANAHSFSKDKVEQVIKALVEGSNSGIAIQHIKAKGTSNMKIVDPVTVLEKTVDRRNSQIHNLEKQLNTSEKQTASLTKQVADLLTIIRDKEQLTNSDDFCNCNDWRSVGSDPVSGDKLKRCNICEKVGVR